MRGWSQRRWPRRSRSLAPIRKASSSVYSLIARFPEDGSEVYRVVFDREAFRNGATKAPNKYLQEVSVETARYVTSYLDSFHREHFADFATDTEAWFRLAYEP
mgnify:CR=1 FL=1